MKITRLPSVIGLSFLLLTAFLFLAPPTAAQEPDPIPPKGSPYTPPTPGADLPTPPTIDRTLLEKIEPALLKQLLTAGEQTPFIVYLTTQVDTAAVAALAPFDAQGQPDEVGQRRLIVETLKQTADSSQGNVRQLLQNSANPGGLSGQSIATNDINPLWIVNAVAARGSLETILALAALPEVDTIQLDRQVQLTYPIVDPPWPLLNPAPSFIPLRQTPEWGISKIRADLVHNALSIDGEGVVVANIDSGVDWLHPDLQSSYRGFTGQGHLPNHLGNWYDATDDNANYPIDGNGHGTHTMGTMVGDGGKGVAPGATWIAVKAFSSGGLALDSWLHDAFQWVLAPNGDPALAPDVVNNSWGSNNGTSLEYEPDLQALLDAGIYPVFSAGNNGPNEGTIGSPGSLDIVLAVGATTIDDEIASFSSRGPSPWGKIKPDVAAPGKDIVSTFPGGVYSSLDGTSMAAPHVSGLVALLLEADPNLANNLSSLTYAITSTTVPLGSPIPNNDFGRGRVDAYNAVMAVAGAGTLQGLVTQSGSGSPIDQATITITPHSGGPTVNTTSAGNGAYIQGLATDIYDATATAFGYEPSTAFNISIVTGTTTLQDFSLTSSPVGTLQGQVREQGSNAPLAATITIDGTPASTSSNPADGSYSLSLPVGTYNVTVVSPDHRVGKATNIVINDGATVTQDFTLATAPSILVVDSGRWYQESEISYFQQALDDALYTYQTYPILDPFGEPGDVPISSTLSLYDIVIWSSPEDSPGFVGAGPSLAGFLDEGGKLLISGQDIAFFDGGGTVFFAPYLHTHLKAKYVADTASSQSITGTIGGPFAGLTLSIAAGDGADNQIWPDVVDVDDPDFAGPLLTYGEEGLAGLHIGQCVPYRAVYLSFGLEGINGRANRQQTMEQTLAWLQGTPAPNGVELTPGTATEVGNFGTVVTHTVRLRNTGANDDTYSLGQNSTWPLNPAPPTNLALTSCQSQTITIGVQINTNEWHTANTFNLTAQSGNAPGLTDIVTRTSKSPAPLLVIDDDRFFDVGHAFQEALDANGIAYDYTEIPTSWNGPYPATPSIERMQWYPSVLWFTGYDWFQPITEVDEARLIAYLDEGGRLLLTSQDMIYNLPDNQPDTFTQNYLGVLTHTEDYSSTQAIGEADNPISNHLGVAPFTFSPIIYRNNSDALIPTGTAQVVTRGEEDQINGVMQPGLGNGQKPWRTTFLAYGPELMAAEDRIPFLRRSIGWLSWLGSTQITASPAKALAGESVTYTAVLTNDGWADLSQAIFTITLPSELSLTSHSPELTPVGGDLVWSGPLAKNTNKAFFYTGTLADPLPIGTVVSQTTWLHNVDHDLRFDRLTDVYVNFPELDQSALTVTPTQNVLPGDTLTYTLRLKNSGLVADPQVVAINSLPHMLNQLQIINGPSKGTLLTDSRAVTWTTPLSVGEELSLTYTAVISYRSSTPIDNVARVDDQLNPLLRLTARTFFEVYPLYFPVIYKN